jgi:hypothetical protein
MLGLAHFENDFGWIEPCKSSMVEILTTIDRVSNTLFIQKCLRFLILDKCLHKLRNIEQKIGFRRITTPLFRKFHPCDAYIYTCIQEKMHAPT